jgi:hypothetical protein
MAVSFASSTGPNLCLTYHIGILNPSKLTECELIKVIVCIHDGGGGCGGCGGSGNVFSSSLPGFGSSSFTPEPNQALRLIASGPLNLQQDLPPASAALQMCHLPSMLSKKYSWEHPGEPLNLGWTTVRIGGVSPWYRLPCQKDGADGNRSTDHALVGHVLIASRGNSQDSVTCCLSPAPYLTVGKRSIFAFSLSTHKKMSFYWLMTHWTSVSLWEQRIAGGGHFFFMCHNCSLFGADNLHEDHFIEKNAYFALAGSQSKTSAYLPLAKPQSNKKQVALPFGLAVGGSSPRAFCRFALASSAIQMWSKLPMCFSSCRHSTGMCSANPAFLHSGAPAPCTFCTAVSHSRCPLS